MADEIVTPTAPVETTNAEPAEKPEAAAAEAAEQKRLWKLKVNGKEEEVDEDTLVREAQVAKAMRAKAQQLGMTAREYNDFKKALDSDPEGALLTLKGDDWLHKIAVDYLSKKLEAEMLSPEERKQREMERRLKQYEEKEKQGKAEREKQERQQLEDFYAKQFDVEIPKAIQSVGLPQTPFVIKRMSELMALNIEEDIDLPAEVIAKQVRQELRQMRSADSLSDEEIEELLNSERVRKRNLEKAKTRPRVAPKGQLDYHSDSDKRKPKTIDDFRAYTERLKRGEE